MQYVAIRHKIVSKLCQQKCVHLDAWICRGRLMLERFVQVWKSVLAHRYNAWKAINMRLWWWRRGTSADTYSAVVKSNTHTHTHIHKLRVPKPAFTLICWWRVKVKTRKKKNKWKRGQQSKQNQSLTHKNCGVYVVWTHFWGVGQQCQNSSEFTIVTTFSNKIHENQITLTSKATTSECLCCCCLLPMWL